MANQMEVFNSQLRDDKFDAFRAEQFDAIMADESLPEVHSTLMQYYNILSSIKGIGDKMAKSFAFSAMRMLLLDKNEEKQFIRMGWLVNSVAPEAWRVQKRG